MYTEYSRGLAIIRLIIHIYTHTRQLFDLDRITGDFVRLSELHFHFRYVARGRPNELSARIPNSSDRKMSVCLLYFHTCLNLGFILTVNLIGTAKQIGGDILNGIFVHKQISNEFKQCIAALCGGL